MEAEDQRNMQKTGGEGIGVPSPLFFKTCLKKSSPFTEQRFVQPVIKIVFFISKKERVEEIVEYLGPHIPHGTLTVNLNIVHGLLLVMT